MLGLLDENAGRGSRVVYRFNGKANVWGPVLRDHHNRAKNAVVAVNYQF